MFRHAEGEPHDVEQSPFMPDLRSSLRRSQGQVQAVGEEGLCDDHRPDLSLTLLGEKAVQEIMSMVRGMENITDSGGGESTGNEVGTSSTSAEGSTPRTRPFIHEQSTTTDSPAQDEAKGKSNTEGISDTRKAPKVLMDVVNGRIPSMGELVEMPAAPAVQPPRRRTSETYADDVISYSDYEIIDPNARFVTDSPFGGYDFESNHGTVPAPATVVVLGIVPLLGRRRQR